MATYDSLSVAEKALLAEADTLIRGYLRTVAGQNLDLSITWFNDNIAPIIATLDASEIIPNSTGLAGAVDMTHENVTTLKNWIETDIEGKIQSNKSLLVKAIGRNV